MSSNLANSGPLRFPHVKVGELIGGYTGSRGHDASGFDENLSVGSSVVHGQSQIVDGPYSRSQG